MSKSPALTSQAKHMRLPADQNYSWVIWKTHEFCASPIELGLDKTHSDHTSSCATGAHEPSLLRLIQNIFRLYPEEAQMILRQPIYTTHLQDPFLHGLKKVLAKRVLWERQPPIPELRAFTHDCSSPLELPTATLERLKDSAASQGSKPAELRAVRSNRAITAQLYGSDGRQILQASNQMSVNRSLHAELVLIQTYLRLGHATLPEGGRLEISLKPCQMCAGLIRSVLPPQQPFKIVYQQLDTGPLSRNTALDKDLPPLVVFGLSSAAESHALK